MRLRYAVHQSRRPRHDSSASMMMIMMMLRCHQETTPSCKKVSRVAFARLTSIAPKPVVVYFWCCVCVHFSYHPFTFSDSTSLIPLPHSTSQCPKPHCAAVSNNHRQNKRNERTLYIGTVPPSIYSNLCARMHVIHTNKRTYIYDVIVCVHTAMHIPTFFARLCLSGRSSPMYSYNSRHRVCAT